MSSKSGDRVRSGQSDILANSKTGDPRSRHANAAPIGEGDIAPPLKIENNRVTVALDPKSALLKTPQGTVTINLGAGLEIVHGSPPRLQARTSQSVVVGRDGRLEARVRAGDVAGIRELVTAATPVIAPFVGAGAGDGVVLDPGGAPLGKFLRDDGTFATPASSSLAFTDVQIDFGANPVFDAKISIVDGAAAPGQYVVINLGNKFASAAELDGYQWDGLIVAAVPAAGQIDLYIQANPGPVSGTREISYALI